MRIEMEFQGIDELAKALEQCATEKEIQGLNKNIVTKAHNRADTRESTFS